MNESASALRHHSRELPPSDVMEAELVNAASPSVAALERLGSDHLAELLGTAGNVVDVQMRDYGERYEAVDILGQGGQGIVLRARDTLLDREVAIKAVRPPYSRQREDSIAREARMSGMLEHPNILPTYDLSEDETGSPFFVMKKAEGITLEELLRKAHSATSGGKLKRRDERGEYSRRRLLAVFLQVCHAVQYAHSRKVVHLDLKPQNVKLGPFGEVYVIDWGFAVHDGEQPRGMAGTPPYLAPERYRGEPVSERCDIYALGVILYRILVNHYPHDKKDLPPGPAAGGFQPPPPPVPPRQRDPSLPKDLQAIVMKALADRPADRYASAGELANDLERFLDVLPVAAYAESPWSRLAKWARRHRHAVAAATVVLCALALIGAGAAYYRARTRAAAESVRRAEEKAILASRETQRAEEETRRAEEDARRAADVARQREAEGQHRLARAKAERERQDAVRELTERGRDLAERLRPSVERESGDEARPARLARLANVFALFQQALDAGRPPEDEANHADPATAAERAESAAAVARELALAHNARGRAYLLALCPDEALADFRRAGDIDPANDNAHYEAGKLLLAAGDATAAAGEFDAIARHRPDSDYLPLGRALLALHERRYDQAVAECDALERAADEAERFPPPDLWLIRARAHNRRGEIDQAIADFSGFLLNRPGDAAVHQERAVLYYRRFLKAQQSGDFITRQPDDFSRALQDWRNVLALNPDAIEARRPLADALYLRAWSINDYVHALREQRDAARKDYSIAEVDYSRARNVLSRLPAGAPLEQADALRREVDDAAKKVLEAVQNRDRAEKRFATFEESLNNDLAEARAEYNAALAQNPDHHASLIGRATLNQMLFNLPDEAGADFHRAVEGARRRLEDARARREQADDAPARAVLDDAIRRHAREYGEAAYRLGLFHLYSDAWAQAAAALDAALPFVADDETRAEIFFRRGQARFMGGNFQAAREDFAAALPPHKLKPTTWALWLWLAECRLGLPRERGRYEPFLQPKSEPWALYLLERILDAHEPTEVDILELTKYSAPERCRAMFHLAAYGAVSGSPEAAYRARRTFQVALETGRDWVLEYRFARHWHGKLPAEPSWALPGALPGAMSAPTEAPLAPPL